MLICSFFSDIPAYLWKPEFSDILYNPTYFPGPLVCRIRQVPLYLKHESSENNHLYSIYEWIKLKVNLIFDHFMDEVNRKVQLHTLLKEIELHFLYFTVMRINMKW